MSVPVSRPAWQHTAQLEPGGSTPPRLVLGDLDAIEQALAADVRRWKERDPLVPVVILVGNTLLRPYLRVRLARLAGGHINLHILTPNQLALRLGAPVLAAMDRQPLPYGADRLLAEEAALRARGYFKPVAQAPGFTQALRQLFRDFHLAGIDPEEFQRGAERAGVSPDKCAALATLYHSFESRRDGFFGPDDCFRYADPSRLDSPCLLVYGPLRPPAVLRQLIERLVERVPVTVYLPMTGTNADDAHWDTIAWLERLEARREPAESRAQSPGATALTHLQARLFKPPAGRAPFDGTVRLVSAPDPAREVREAARAVLRWAREGIGFHEMAIVYRHDEPYRPLVDEVFRETGIPVYLHDGRPVAEHPVGRRILALLDLIGSPLRRSAVMDFLIETVLPAKTAERYGPVEPAAWDALSREAGIVEGREQWRDRLRLLALAKRRDSIGDGDEPDDRLQAALDQIDRLARFVDDLAERLDARPARGSWNAHLAFLRQIVEDYVDGGLAIVDEIEALSGLDRLVPEVPFSRFQRQVRAALQTMNADGLLQERSGRFARAGVNVLDVNSLRLLRFRAVAVLGLAERSFPAAPRQDALLLDWERRRLNEVMGWDLPLRALGPDLEPLQFTLAVQAAEERLQISYPRGAAGTLRPHLPSHFFLAAAAALTGARVPIGDVDRLPAEIFTRVPASRFGAGSPDEALTPGEYDLTLLSSDRPLGEACLAAERAAFARARQAWTARWQNDRLTVYDGALTGAACDAVRRKAGLWRAISPTRLETYATCPFRFFLQYLLKLQPVEEPELLERIEALERGSLIHDVLDRFLSECGEADPPREARRADHLARLRRIAEEECAEREHRGLVGYPLLWQLDRKAILEDLVVWYDREVADGLDAGFRPGAFEVRFGPAWREERGSPLSIDDPLPIAIDGMTLRFQGRIDRVDWTASRTAFRVIDYKTGKKSQNHKDGRLSGGKALQLPIYLLAAARALDLDLERGEAQYFYATRRGDFQRVRFSGETLAGRWDEFTALLGGLAESIGDGTFHPVPGDNAENCRWCDFKTVCDARVDRLAARKAGDDRAVRFARVTEVE